MAKIAPQDVQIGFCEDGYVQIKAPANFKEAKNPVRGVRAVDIRMSVDEIPTATLELFLSDFSIKAKSRFVATHPVTGETKEIEKMIFKDGSEWPE